MPFFRTDDSPPDIDPDLWPKVERRAGELYVDGELARRRIPDLTGRSLDGSPITSVQLRRRARELFASSADHSAVAAFLAGEEARQLDADVDSLYEAYIAAAPVDPGTRPEVHAAVRSRLRTLLEQGVVTPSRAPRRPARETS